MQGLQKVKIRVNFGGGINALCLAGAFAIVMGTVMRVAEYDRRKEEHEMFKKTSEAHEEMLSKVTDILSKMKEENVQDDEQ